MLVCCACGDGGLKLPAFLSCPSGQVCLICEGIDLNDIDHVELDPGWAYTGPGTSFRVEAIPALANGLPVRGQGIPVAWPSSPFMHQEGAFGVFEIPADAGAQELSGISPGVNGKTPSTPGKVRIGRPLATPGGDVLLVPHTPGVSPEGILLDWKPSAGPSDCTETGSKGLAMAGEAHLDVALTGACGPEVGVFSQDGGAQHVGAPSAATGPLSLGTVPIRSVFGYLRTDLAAPSDPAGFEGAVLMTKALAIRALYRNRTGIFVEWGDFAEEFPLGASTATPVTVPFPATCEDGAINGSLGVPMTLTEAPAGEALPQHELFFVFVPEIVGQIPAYTCDRTPKRGPVVVLSTLHFKPTSLAHELGHVFGLYFELPSFGHTDGRGFTQGNLLHGAPDVCSGWSRESLTLGQLFRMNFDTGSWLRHKANVDLVRACTFNFDEDLCPAVAVDFPRGNE